MPTYADEDPRELPGPLGWCCQCLRRAEWARAKTMFEGSTLCAQCLLDIADWHPEALDYTIEANATEEDARLRLSEKLREAMHTKSNSSGF